MTLEGPLNKWTNHFHGWQYRFFVLDIERGLLSYYLSKEQALKAEMRGCIKLNEAFVGYDKDDDILFTITVGDETFHLQAANLAEKEKWVSRIEKAIILSHKRANSVDKGEARITQEEIIAAAERFDQTVTELDAYLQCLIEQHKALELRVASFGATESTLNADNEEANDEVDASESAEETSDDQTKTGASQLTDEEAKEEKKNTDRMLASTKTLIETVKHSIVCLQIAKVNSDPRNGLHTNNDLKQVLSFFNKNTRDSSSSNSINGESTKNEDSSDSSSATNFTTNNIKHQTESQKAQTATSTSASLKSSTQQKQGLLTIPLSSFSTSDDEENVGGAEKILTAEGTDDDNESFYDAVSSGDDNDNEASDETLPAVVPKCEDKITDGTSQLAEEFQSKAVLTADSVDVEDDEEEFDEEDLDVNSQSSVITHLLTQVRIGMDLTKITLPTFILETRSLLEMYADFFACTELFLKIPDIECPHERMIQVVRWYMSTFRAGRKSPVAKKPYNPILGEIFQCWYNLPTNSTQGPKTIVKEGPVPWATNDQLAFVAEQVSHHPPISAFYAEHLDKRVQLEGHTWTKSSFLGLSIAVHMVGKATLTLLDREEEYVMTFPSAYGRSILGVPWFEMGGQVQIDCPKTGYQSNIQFLTKPFYGGKKHQISGTICGPDKKVLNQVDGDWNGTMFLKTGKKIEILINTQAMGLIRKQTRKLKEQCEFESRRIWKDVTYNLRSKQLDQATMGKQKIEQRQREGVKKRKEQGVEWQTRYFDSHGEHWTYKNPLKNRLKSPES